MGIVEEGETAPEKEGFIYGAGVDFWYRVFLHWALEWKDNAFLKDHIQRLMVTPAGYVEYGHGNPVIACAPGTVEKCRKAIVRALEALRKSPEIEKARTSFKAIEMPVSRAGAGYAGAWECSR